MSEIEKYSEIEIMPVSVVEAQNRAEMDIQIVTAKNYPRNVKRAIENCIAVVSSDPEIAKVCHYSLPRGGKDISGASVHLARIIASEYRNLRVDSKIVDIDAKMLTAQCVCIDLESNYAIRTEVKRRITTKQGQRFNDDMIVVTANAAMAIAQRNAILQVIPRVYTDRVYKAVKQTITGDISDESKLLQKRKEILDSFKDEYGVSADEIVKLLGVGAVGSIKKEQILTLVGLANSIKDGDTTVDEAFGRKNVDVSKTSEKAKEAMEKAKNKDIEPNLGFKE